MATIDIITGTVRSDQVASQKIPVYMDDFIAFEDESSYRFESLARRINGSTSKPNTKIEWMEMGLFPNIMKAQGASAAGTTIAVDHPEYAHLDQLVYNTRTHEIYLMNETTGGTGTAGSITVVNHSGSGNFTTAVADGDTLIVLPEAHAEGEDVPTGWSAKPRFLYTYIMQSDLPVPKYTDIMKEQAEYGEKQLFINRKQKWIEWKRARNLMMYLGQKRREILSASGPRRHTADGLRAMLTSNRLDFSSVPGGLTVASVGEILRKTTLKGASSDMKVGIAGQNAWVSVSQFPSDKIQITQGEKSFGWVVNRIVTPFGTLGLEYDPTLSAENGLADVMVALDMQRIKPVHLGSLRDRMYIDIQNTRDIHNMEDVITGTHGLVVQNEEFSAWAEGIN